MGQPLAPVRHVGIVTPLAPRIMRSDSGPNATPAPVGGAGLGRQWHVQPRHIPPEGLEE